MKEILKVDTKFIIMGLVAIFLLGLPVRIQNINLDGYISDDAWWHYRQIREVVEHGRRPKVDIYEFTTLNRPMTYPPYFHYLLGYGYRIFGRGMPLIKFTHYVNLMESFLYILIIYWLSLILTGDKLMSLLGCVAASSIYAMIIRARAGELMAFVVSDLFGLAGLAVMLSLVKAKENKFLFLGSAVGGVLFGLSALSWEGALYIYLPLLVLLFVAVLIYDNSRGKKKSLKLFAPALMLTTVITLSWYAPLVAKYGFNPHPPDISWFVELTPLRHHKPLPLYFYMSGIVPILFIPLGWIWAFKEKNEANLFILFWIILGVVATFIGWRGYIAVVPIIACVMVSFGAKGIIRFLFRDNAKAKISLFIFLTVVIIGVKGYLEPVVGSKAVNPQDINQVHANVMSAKMLGFLKQRFNNPVALDHMSWVSEDEALGRLRMVNGQYLEYLPRGAGEILKDAARIYFLAEEEAYKICSRYKIDLIITRKQFFQSSRMNFLLSAAGLKSEDYMRLVKEVKESGGAIIDFTDKGREAILFRMLNRQRLEYFELIYADNSGGGKTLSDISVYKVKKN